MHRADREILGWFAERRVPGDWLDRPVESHDATLGWGFRHIADGPDWWMAHYMKDGRPWSDPWPGPFDRAEVLDALAASRRRVLDFFEAGEGRLSASYHYGAERRDGAPLWTGRNRVLYLTDHEVHHRAKMVDQLRRWGFADFPPMP